MMESSKILLLWRTTLLMRHHWLLQTRLKSQSGVSLKAIMHTRLQKFRQNQNLEEYKRSIDEVESLIAQKHIELNSSNFESIKHADEKRKAKVEELKERKVEEPSKASTSFPYNIDPNPDLFLTKPVNDFQTETEEVTVVADKGFFVKGNEYMDDYIAATAADLPEDEMNECPYHFVGSDDAVETIDFQMPGQKTIPKDKASAAQTEENDDDEWKANYSTEDASVTTSVSSCCTGCGAKLHCQDSALPGFVPVEILKTVIDKEEKNARRKAQIEIDELCRRCYMLKNHNFLLNVNVCEVDYERMMGHLRLIQEALILLVVDMTDISGSIHSQLPNIIGDSKPMIVIGNKVDLLPPDARPGYLKRYRDSLIHALNESGLSKRFNILHTTLVSAKTGFGIESLVTNIYQKWIGAKGALRSDIYLIGCTNAGKSTLFNSFLQSDLCKVRALDLVERVTTSVWPGTTLSLLKFPLMNPSPLKLELRRRRLLLHQAWAKKEQSAKYMLYSSTKDPKFLTLSGVVDNSFKEAEDAAHPVSSKLMTSIISNDPTLPNTIFDAKKKHGVKLTDRIFTEGKWCFDTPGTVSRNQVLDLYTLEELITLVPRQLIMPQIAIIHPGQSLLLGGTARLDVLPTTDAVDKPIYLTIFCSDRLPLHVISTDEVESFMEKFNGTKVMGVPFGDKDRLEAFPVLEGMDIEMKGKEGQQAISDIVFSSIGWVSVNSIAKKLCFKALTPQGRGITTRNPLIPYALKYKKSRIAGTAFYKLKPLMFEMDQDKKDKFQGRRRSRNRMN